MYDCKLSHAEAARGGGAFAYGGGKITATRCEFSKLTGEWGGGMYARGDGSSLTAYKSTFSNNRAIRHVSFGRSIAP